MVYEKSGASSGLRPPTFAKKANAQALFGKRVPVGRVMVGYGKSGTSSGLRPPTFAKKANAQALFGKRVPVGRVMVGYGKSEPSSALRAPSSRRRPKRFDRCLQNLERTIIRPAGTFFPKKAKAF